MRCEPKRVGEREFSLAFDAAAVVAGLLALLALWLRLYRIGAQSVWYDEAYAVSLASQPVGSILSEIEPGHVPLYFVMLHLWILLVGQGEMAVRFLSLIAGVLTIPLTYVLGKRLLGPRVGVAAAGITAVSPFLVYYSQETRMYALLATQGVLSTYLLARAIHGEKKHWLPYVLVSVSLLYTHYYGLFLIAAQLLFALLKAAVNGRLKASRGGSDLILLAAVYAGIGLLFLPWALARAQVFETYVSASRASLSLTSLLSRMLINFSTGHSVEAAHVSESDPEYAHDHTLGMLLGGGSLLISIVGLAGSLSWPSKGRKHSRGSLPVSQNRLLALLVILVVVCMLAAYVTSLGKRDFASRYLVYLAPMFYILVAAGLKSLWSRWLWLSILAMAFLAGSTGFALANYYGNDKYAREDFRSVASYLIANARTDEAIICNAGYSQIALDYYYRGGSARFQLPAEHPPQREPTEQRLEELAKEYDYLWLLVWQDYYSDPERYVERWLDTHAFSVDQQVFHGKIRVKGYITSLPVVEEALVPNRLGKVLGDKVELVGYEFGPAIAGRNCRVTLYWRAVAPLEKDYTVFVHLFDSAGAKWSQHDSMPAGGSYPTSKWLVGEVVRDEHLLAIPPFTPPVDFRLEVGMYELATLERLGTQEQNLLTVGRLPVQRGVDERLDARNRCDALFEGKLALVGYDYTRVQRGAELPLVLYWRCLAPVGADYTVFIHLLDAGGTLRAQGDGPPARGIYPTSHWQPGETVRDPRSLTLPADLPSGEYRLVAGLYEPPTGKRLAVRSGWLGRADDKVTLGTVRLE